MRILIIERKAIFLRQIFSAFKKIFGAPTGKCRGPKHPAPTLDVPDVQGDGYLQYPQEFQQKLALNQSKFFTKGFSRSLNMNMRLLIMSFIQIKALAHDFKWHNRKFCATFLQMLKKQANFS